MAAGELGAAGCRCSRFPCVCCPKCSGRGYLLVAVEELLDDDGDHVLAMGYKPRRCSRCDGAGVNRGG